MIPSLRPDPLLPRLSSPPLLRVPSLGSLGEAPDGTAREAAVPGLQQSSMERTHSNARRASRMRIGNAVAMANASLESRRRPRRPQAQTRPAPAAHAPVPQLALREASVPIAVGNLVTLRHTSPFNALIRHSESSSPTRLAVPGLQFLEVTAFYGVYLSLIVYLQDVLHGGSASNVAAVNSWAGVSYLMPVLGAAVADSYLVKYKTMLIGGVHEARRGVPQ